MFNLFVDSSTSVSLEPEYDFSGEDEKLESTSRSKTGKRYVYRYGKYQRWKFSLMYISSADALQLNTWWDNNTELLFAEDGDVQVNSVTIVNSKLPINERVEPYFDLFQGTIELETY